jgi:hypothetical protein
MALRIEGHIELRQAFHSTVTTAQCQVANLSLVIEERISRKKQETPTYSQTVELRFLKMILASFNITIEYPSV